jgi:hypothetical protein
MLAVLLRRIAAPRRREGIRAGRQMEELERAVRAGEHDSRRRERRGSEDHARARQRDAIGGADDRTGQ